MEEQRITQSGAVPSDVTQDFTLRPQHLDDFVGQNVAKENLKIFIEAAKLRNEPLDHLSLIHISEPTRH